MLSLLSRIGAWLRVGEGYGDTSCTEENKHSSDSMAEDKSKVETPYPASTRHEQTLEKLERLEEKLKLLRDFNEQSENIRETRNKLLENLMILNNEAKFTKSKMALSSKRVKFAEEDEDTRKKTKKTMGGSASKASIQSAQRSKSLHQLLSNLSSWQDEMEQKDGELQKLIDIRKKSSLIHKNTADEKIKVLEMEKDELNERILQFVLHNITEGREEYQELINQLEDENKEMEDRMSMLHRQIGFLKETNIALMRENEMLARRDEQSSTISLALQEKFRKSIMTKGSKSFSMMGEGSFLSLSARSSSQQFNLDMENEDKISLDRDSTDSFKLDATMATWKTDDETMQNNLGRLEQDLHDMEVIQMKLNLIKRYVRKHGTKSINRNTLIDPSRGLGLWF